MRRHLKDTLQMTNMNISYMEVAADCILTKPKAKRSVPWESLEVKKKRYNVKKAQFIEDSK